MEHVLTMLTHHAAPCLHRKRWLEQLGEGLVSVLERHGLLENKGQAESYPCGGFCGGKNQRRVLDTPEPDGTWAVVCGDDEQSCVDLMLSSADLELQAISPTALASWLREALRARGTALRFAQHKGVEGLGSLIWEGEEREAIMALGCGRAGLRQLLQDLERLRARSVVFVPSLVVLDGEWQARFAPGSAVEVVDLRKLVAVEAGRLVLVPARSGPQRMLPVREPAGVPYAAEPIVAEVFESTGKRGLSAAACLQLVEQRATFDLFLDLTRVVEGSRHLASKREASGEVMEASLSRHEAEAAAELIRRRLPLGQGEFETISVQAPRKLIERMRQVLDVRQGRYEWRAIHTIRGDTAETRRWHFKPPATLKFAVLVPFRG